MRAQARVIRAASRCQIPWLLWGAPGEGKSGFVEAIAAADDRDCITVIGSIREPSDFAGIPFLAGDAAGGDPDDVDVRLARTSWFRHVEQQPHTLLFFDELTTTAPATQSAMLRVLQERHVGEHPLPEQTVLGAAANPPEQATDGYDLSAPMANRFLHLDWQLSVDDWITGMTVGWDQVTPAAEAADLAEASEARQATYRARVAAFIRHRPDLIRDLPTNPLEATKGWPSPRSWTHTAMVLAHLPDNDHEARLLAAKGLVGEGPAVEVLTWLEHDDLPDPAAVLADPTMLDPGEQPHRLYALLAGVVAHAANAGDADTWNAAWDVLARAADGGRADVGAAAARDLMRAWPADATSAPTAARAFLGPLKDAGLAADLAA